MVYGSGISFSGTAYYGNCHAVFCYVIQSIFNFYQFMHGFFLRSFNMIFFGTGRTGSGLVYHGLFQYFINIVFCIPKVATLPPFNAFHAGTAAAINYNIVFGNIFFVVYRENVVYSGKCFF